MPREVIIEARGTCPVCDKPVKWDVECPGYPRIHNGERQTSVCYPPCGNADYWSCSDDACPWWYAAP